MITKIHLFNHFRAFFNDLMDGIDSSDEDDPQSVLEPAKQDKLDVHSTVQQDKSVLENSNMDIKAEKTDTVKV